MSWLSLIPPVLVFLIGLTTRRIILSLFSGVVSAAFIASNYHLVDSLQLIGNRIWDNTDMSLLLDTGLFSAGNLLIMCFVFILGITVEMIRRSDSAAAFVAFTENSIRSSKAAETCSLLLSHFLCIDDYLSSLTTGSVMRHVTDRFRVPRAKLAFLTDSMAAPIALITPISSWAAAIIGFLTENGVSENEGAHTLLLGSPTTIYLHILPYVFYSCTLVLSIWFIVRFRISFGPMAEHERIAQATGNLRGGKEAHALELNEHHTNGRGASIVDFLLPLLSLFGTTAFLLLKWGDAAILGGNHGIIDALQSAPIAPVLFTAGSFALVLSMGYYYLTRMFSFTTLCEIVKSGVMMMLPVNVILVLSWALGDLLREDLMTGQWLATLVSGSIPAFLIPLILFWNAALISNAIGSSWATAAILFPIALPMVMEMMGTQAPVTIEQMPILLPVFGAILSGAVCGDHISLISQTTIMATTSAGCDHMDHVKTQWIYALPIFIGSSAGFAVSGMIDLSSPVIAIGICTGAAAAVSLGMMSVLHWIYADKHEKAYENLG